MYQAGYFGAMDYEGAALNKTLTPDDTPPSTANAKEEILEVLRDAKILARRFYQLTGKPLGITGEVAEYEAATKLGLTLHCARQAGYDATEIQGEHLSRIQIKGRCIADPARLAGRLGSIDLMKPFDAVLLVLLDSEFNAYAMYQADRDVVVSALMKPGSVARNVRGALALRQFISISALRWHRE